MNESIRNAAASAPARLYRRGLDMRRVGGWAILASIAALTMAGPAAAQTLLERSPYRIRLVVTTDGSPGLLERDAAALEQQLLQAIDLRIGGAWTVEPAGDAMVAAAVKAEPTESPAEDVQQADPAQAPGGLNVPTGATSAQDAPAEVSPSPASSASEGGDAAATAVATVPPVTLRRVARRGLRTRDRLEAETLAASSAQFDKILFVHVGAAAWGAYDITAREFDVRTQTLGTVAWLECAQRPMLPSVAYQAMLQAFSPVGEVEAVSGSQATLRMKAAALPLPDKQLRFLHEGDILRATVRFNYRDGSLRRLHPIEWTFLVVRSVEGPLATCEIHTGLRSPLSARRRGLVEQLAVVVQPTYGDTQLQLVAAGTENEPLPGYAVHAQVPGEVATTLLGQTDRQGQIMIPPVDTPLRILLIMHGGELLARLPIVPGLEPHLVAQVPDDRLRFQVEAAMAGIQEQVIDVYARRTVLLAQCEAQLEAGNLALAQRLLEELQKLKKAEAFQSELNQLERRTFVNDARMKRRIDKLIGDTRQVVERQLVDGEIQRLAAEVQKRLQGGAQ